MVLCFLLPLLECLFIGALTFGAYHPNVNVFLVVVLLGDGVGISVNVACLFGGFRLLLLVLLHCNLIVHLLCGLHCGRLPIFALLADGGHIECLYLVVWCHVVCIVGSFRHVTHTIVECFEVGAHAVTKVLYHGLGIFNELVCSTLYVGNGQLCA